MQITNHEASRHDPRTSGLARARAAGTSGAFRLGGWLVEPTLSRIAANGVEHVVEPKAMDVLVHLATRPGEVISSEQLIQSVWLGRPMGDNPVHKCVSQLRSALGDDARRPRFIGTIPKRGYRLLACVEPLGRAHEPASMAAPIRLCIDIWPAMRMGPDPSDAKDDLPWVSPAVGPSVQDIAAVLQRIAQAVVQRMLPAAHERAWMTDVRHEVSDDTGECSESR